MIVIGLDPGIAKFGYGILRHERGRVSFVAAGVITTPSSEPMSTRLASLAEELRAVLASHQPDSAVIERLVPGPNKNLGVVAEARGIALLLLGERDIPFREESPKAVKMLATRHGGATKMQVRKTVQRLLSLETLPATDAADALALAFLGK